MVNLIHWKRVPLLHNTVLILCDEGDGLVAVHSTLKTRSLLYRTHVVSILKRAIIGPPAKRHLNGVWLVGL